MSERRAVQVLCDQLCEFYSSYILLGYRRDGSRADNMVFLPTTKDGDAIQQLMEDTIKTNFAIVDRVVVESGPGGES